MMDKVVNINEYRRRVLEKKMFGFWVQRLNESFGLDTRLSNLSDRTLFTLAQPGDDSTRLYYELIMGELDYGPTDHFRYLDNHQKMTVVDIHMFLADHGRFEMMYRLGWLNSHGCLQRTLVTIVRQFKKIKPDCLENFPELNPTHADHKSYQRLISREKQVFIRRMLNDALENFKKRLALPT